MNKKGVTLIELIVVVAIVGIIATVTANIFIFGKKSFDKSEKKSSQQMDRRLAVQTISRELRYADDIDLFKDEKLIKPNSLNGNDKKYIYFDEVSKKIMKKDGNKPAYEFLIGNQEFEEIYFKVEDTEELDEKMRKKKVLELFIDMQEKLSENDEENDKDDYDIKTTISLLNENDLTDKSIDDKFRVIEYTK